MAKKIEGPIPGTPAIRGYDWNTWSDGSTWLLEQGIDYSIDSERMRQRAHAWAYNHGMKVQTRVAENKIWVRFFHPEKVDVPKKRPAKKAAPRIQKNAS